jgi:hypothetical protein
MARGPYLAHQHYRVYMVAIASGLLCAFASITPECTSTIVHAQSPLCVCNGPMKSICIIALKQLGLYNSGGALYLNLWTV